MKTITEKWKQIFFITLFVLVCIFVFQKPAYAAGKTVPAAVDNLTVHLRKTVNMTATSDGYMRVVYDGKKIRIEYYDTQFQILRKKSLNMELPIWGGFYAGSDGYYLAEAKSNTAEKDSAEVIRVIKYDKNWKRIGAAKITGNPELFGGEVRYPFDYGCVEMAEHGQNLYLVTGHEGYVDDSVGQGHQGYLMIRVDKKSMRGEIVDADLWHSFAQYIKADGSNLYVLEQSEGSRYTKLSKYNAETLENQAISVLDYGGSHTSVWALACYASVDDLAVSADNILSLGTSIDQSKYDQVKSTTPHNLYLTVTPKNNFSKKATTVKWLTKFTGKGESFLGAKLTKINNNRFLVSWEVTEKKQKMTGNDPLSVSVLHYVFVNGKGEKISKEFTAAAPVSDCQPIVKGSKIIYTASSSNAVDFYSINANSGAFQKKVYRVAGEKAMWSLANGVMTISGTGAVNVDTEVHYRYPFSSTAGSYSYSNFDNAWKDVRGSVKKLVIGKGITSIPAEEFRYFDKLKEVTIKEGLKTIGKQAFYSCGNLNKIIIPASVTSIGKECLATGYYWIGGKPVVNAKIYAPKGSYAIKYAKKNGIAYAVSSTTGITGKKVSMMGLTSPKSKTLKVKWKKISSADGYQIQYASNAKFTKNKKNVTVKKASTTTKTIQKLKKKSRYYVRVRAYKKVNGKTTYSKWSSTKSVKTK